MCYREMSLGTNAQRRGGWVGIPLKDVGHPLTVGVTVLITWKSKMAFDPGSFQADVLWDFLDCLF